MDFYVRIFVLSFKAARRPSRCTVPACLCLQAASALVGVAFAALATYGLILVRADPDDGTDPNGPHLVRIKMHPAFEKLMIRLDKSNLLF
jgi:hypothetical protein